MNWFNFNFQDFSFSFLSILFEGVPFLLLGALISGFVDAFLPTQTLLRFIPKRGTIPIAGLMGLVLPICECGSVVVIRRFIRKGLPVPAAVTYMLAAPIVSPIVAVSTYAAFRGQDPLAMTSLRLAFGYGLAVAVGMIMSRFRLDQLLKKAMLAPTAQRRAFTVAADGAGDELEPTFLRKVIAGIRSTTSDFIDVAFFFVIGAALAAVFNTAIRQEVILPLAERPALATLAMMVFAFVLAICSSSDAFIAATFTSFPQASKLAFLVFGPMVDVKLLFLYGLIFKRRVIGLLAAGLFVVIAIVCIQLAAHQL